MDAVLCLPETTHFQSMELERPEAICGLEPGTRSRLWSTRGDCAHRQEVAFFWLRLSGTVQSWQHYNGPRECLSPLARNLALMKFNPRLARAVWAKSTVPKIAGLVVMLPSRSCRNRWRETPTGCGALKLRRGRLRR